MTSLTDEQILELATTYCYARTAVGGFIFDRERGDITAFARALLSASKPAAPDFTAHRLKVAEDCNERLMNACTDTGCPDGVNMAEWIRGLDMLAASPAACNHPSADIV